MEAYFAKVGTLPHLHDTHSKREKLVVTDSKLRTVQREYFDLKNFSLIARYECRSIKAKEVTTEAVPALDAIKKHIKGLL